VTATGTAPIRRVLVVAKLGHGEAMRIAAELADWLAARGVEVRLDRETAAALGRGDGTPRAELAPDLDLAIVAGGDGTLLSIARGAAPHGIPILGINSGSLGFLTELQPDEAFAGVEAVLGGSFTIDERQTLRVRAERAGRPAEEYTLLNDAVITKSALARMITVDVRIDGTHVATHTSDGLIVATPTGSTAYNLSAGGPILDPRVQALVISPICPHTLAYRPLVVPSSVHVELTLQPPVGEVYVTLDGQIGFPFDAGDRLEITDAPRRVRLVRVSTRSFFEILRRKLRWGER
jgi:NAD+ kinase